MTAFTTSSAGDRIAYDRDGDGPPVLFVQPAGQTRSSDPITGPTLRALADLGRTAAVHDRVGRGESEGDPPITLERELAAIDAMLDVLGPSTIVGWSSGAAIALAAALRNEAVRAVVVFEAPLDPGGGRAGEFLAGLRERIRAGDREGTVEFFMQDMPPEWLESAKAGPAWSALLELSPAFEADAEALAWAESAPLDSLLASLDVPVLALTADDALPFMHDAATAIARATGGTFERIDGSQHAWDPPALAARVARLDAVGAAPRA